MEKKRPTANDIKRIAKNLKKNGFHVYRYSRIMALSGELVRDTFLMDFSDTSPMGFSAARTDAERPIVSINWRLDNYVAVRIWPSRGRKLAQKALDVVYGEGVFDLDKLEQRGFCIKLPLDLSQTWIRRKKDD